MIVRKYKTIISEVSFKFKSWVVENFVNNFIPICIGMIVSFQLASCQKVEYSEYNIDKSLQPTEQFLFGFDGGSMRPVAVAIWPDGTRSELVSNEIIFHSNNSQNLARFLDKYNAEILRNGSLIDIPDVPRRGRADEFPAGPILVRVDLSTIDASDFSSTAERLGTSGNFVFSSEDAAKLLTIVSRESDLDIAPNFLAYEDNSLEHPNGSGGFLNTDDSVFWHLSDTNVATNVTLAWDYLNYHCIPPCGDGIWEPAVVALVDRGFNLDPQTGVPREAGGADYSFTGSKPLQIDPADNDGTAGGMSNNSDLPWHGQGAFGVCCAKPANKYGGAGTGGPVVRPMLVRHTGSLFERADGVRQATFYGADVINISSGVACGIWCKTPVYDAHRALQSAIDTATAFGVAVVASAGNDGDDLTGKSRIPCTLRNVICVGAINRSKSNVENFGSPVDIWAPTRILSTITPVSRDVDINDTGINEIKRFGGTSAAAPFVSGVLGLLKTIDKNQTENFLNCDQLCSHVQHLEILQQTANKTSADTKVARGYVDALAAVMALLPNVPPGIEVLGPQNGSSRSWNGVTFSTLVTDSEPGHMLPKFKDNYSVRIESDLESELCTATIDAEFIESAPIPEMRCRAVFSQLGEHRIEATAADPFGATATASFNITITNARPEVDIRKPAPGVVFNTNETIQFSARVSDLDESINILDIVWRDGATEIGTGAEITAELTEGDHEITVRVTDQFGEVAEDSQVISIVSGAAFPSVEIVSAHTGLNSPETVFEFEAMAEDPEDGIISGGSMVWVSSIDGFLGSGPTISTVLSGPAQVCNPESVSHEITVTATDSDGNSTSASTVVSVGHIC